MWAQRARQGLHRLGSYGHNVAVVFSHDGKQLASAAEDRVTLWDAATGEQLHRLRNYGDNVAVVFSPDGKQLSSISTNRATSSTAAASTRARMTLSETNKLPYNLDDTKDIGKIDFLHDPGMPMAQVRNALL